MSKAPERIFLNDDGDFETADSWSGGDVSWCREKVYTGDTEYIRADVVKEMRRKAKEMRRALTVARDGLIWAETHLQEKLGMKSVSVSDALMFVTEALAAHPPQPSHREE